MRVLASAVIVAASSAHGGVILDFEGLADQDDVLGFYDGGMSSSGAMGTDFGISFTNGLALIDSDAGGSGNFANEPSPDTVLFPGDPSGSIIIDVPVGFISFSTYYTTIDENFGFIDFYDGPNGTGNQLSHIGLGALGSGGPGDPTGDFNTWALISADFSAGSPAFSIVMGAVDSTAIGFDNMSFVLVPAPGALVLLALAGVRPRRRR
jgi:hypothetical protein